MTEYSNDFLDNLNKFEQIEQKRFEIKNESMQMKSASKVQFGQLNDKWFCFSNGIISLLSGHPYLEELRKEEHKYQDIHKIIQTKKDFLKKERKVLESIPRFNILKQIFTQIPILYELDYNTKFILSGWKATKEPIQNGSWKWVPFTMGSFIVIF